MLPFTRDLFWIRRKNMGEVVIPTNRHFSRSERALIAFHLVVFGGVIKFSHKNLPYQLHFLDELHQIWDIFFCIFINGG